jgi:signal peptidase I
MSDPATSPTSPAGSSPRASITRRRRLTRILTVIAVAAGALLIVRHSVAEIFYIPVASLEPELPKDSRVLVYKLGSAEPGDIVAYRHSRAQAYVGRVDQITPTGLIVSRNGVSDIAVDAKDVIGRIVAGTR